MAVKIPENIQSLLDGIADPSARNQDYWNTRTTNLTTMFEDFLSEIDTEEEFELATTLIGPESLNPTFRMAQVTAKDRLDQRKEAHTQYNQSILRANQLISTNVKISDNANPINVKDTFLAGDTEASLAIMKEWTIKDASQFLNNIQEVMVHIDKAFPQSNENPGGMNFMRGEHEETIAELQKLSGIVLAAYKDLARSGPASGFEKYGDVFTNIPEDSPLFKKAFPGITEQDIQFILNGDWEGLEKKALKQSQTAYKDFNRAERNFDRYTKAKGDQNYKYLKDIGVISDDGAGGLSIIDKTWYEDIAIGGDFQYDTNAFDLGENIFTDETGSPIVVDEDAMRELVNKYYETLINKQKTSMLSANYEHVFWSGVPIAVGGAGEYFKGPSGEEVMKIMEATSTGDADWDAYVKTYVKGLKGQ